MASVIDTAAKRAKLPLRKNPYWHGVSGGRGGLSLGFRPSAKGAGAWVAKVVIDGRRIEERIGLAESKDATLVNAAMSFPTATTTTLEWGKRQVAAIDAGRVAEDAAKIPTVRLLVDEYVASRKARTGRSGSASSLKLHISNDTKVADIKLKKLTAADIEGWRARLPVHLMPSTKNRLLNDLRAALYAGVLKNRRTIPAHIPAEIKVGTKAESGETAARRQLLTDSQVRDAIYAAFAVDPDFGELTLLAGSTGARFSQMAQLAVADLQIANRRVMMPSSKKGKNRKAGMKVAVPLEASVIERLSKGLKRDRRGPWKEAYEVEKHWAAVVKLASLPEGTVMYALRHSSIVRGLRAGLPVRLVAALHDTSIKMIEQHYSAFIIDMTEELARKSLMSFAAAQPIALQAAE
jgi:integrase